MYIRVKLALIICVSCCFLIIFNFFLHKNVSRKYYLNVVQQSYQIEQEKYSTPAKPETDVDSVLFGANKTCQIRKRLIFAKTHKTGSTTLQNIIHRFGQENHLMFLLPKNGAHYFNLQRPFSRSMAELYPAFNNVR